MDAIASNLKEAETKQRSLRKAHGSLRAQADSLLAFISQWEDLQDHFDSIGTSLRTEYRLLESRAAELNAIESSFEQGQTSLRSLQSSIQLEENRLRKYSKELESKERQLGAVQAKVEDQWKEFDSRDEQIRAKETLIEEYDRQIRTKEHKLVSLEKLLVDKSKVVELQTKDFTTLAKSVRDWEGEVKLKEMEIKTWVEKVEKQLESKVEQLNLMDKKLSHFLAEVQLKEKHLHSREKRLDALDKSMQERMRRAGEGKELELEQLLQEKADVLQPCQMKTDELEYIPKSTAVISWSTSIQSSINRDSRSLQLLMNAYFQRTDFVYSEVSMRLQGSSEPEKLVLDSMQEFYPSDLDADNREFGFGLSVIRRSCIHLLKELKRISPNINGQVREAAKKLAAEWRAKMTVSTENWLEVLGLLWLLTAYNLHSAFDPKELESFRCIAAEHEPSAVMRGLLDLADKAPVNSNICFPTKTEKPECSLEKNAATFSTPKAELPGTMEATNLQGFPNEYLSGNLLPQNAILQIAPCASLPDAIRNLIGKKKVIEAVSFICTFNLIDKFPPVPLLKEYVEDARKCSREIYRKKKLLDEKDKVVDEQIADLRRVIQCIKDYNLESAYPARDIEKKITQLQQMKDNWRHMAARLASKVEEKQKQGKKRSTSTFVPKFQAKQHKSNCQLPAISAVTPSALPTPSPGYLQSSSTSFRCENYGHPGQFSVSASEKDLAKGNCFHCNEFGHWKRRCPRYLSELKNVNLDKSLLSKVP